MPEEKVEEILSDKEVITKKILQMRLASVNAKTGAELQRKVREYILAQDLDIEPKDATETKLLNAEKQIEFETLVIEIADSMLKELK